jgi:cell division protein FtsZ
LPKIEQNSRHTAADKNKELEAVLRSHLTRIRVVGCGGGGNNTLTRLMEVGVNGIETVAINTDAQDLLSATADDKILIGQSMTKGLGAGSNPQIGEDSAHESQAEIEEALLNADLVFVTCGLGGGTGTGSAPIVAEIAKKSGALTIAIVTLPFADEGISRSENALRGLEKLRRHSDTVIAIQNDRLLEVVPDLPLDAAFKVADEILVNAVRGITELITEKGLINLDFADVRTIMQNGGAAMIGIGESEEREGAQAAVEMAMQNKLLDVDIAGAQNALINITGGAQMPLKDAKMVMKCVAEKLDPAAKIIWGARVDQNLGKTIRVMLIVTNLREKPDPLVAREKSFQAQAPRAVKSAEEPLRAPAIAKEREISAPDTTAESKSDLAETAIMPAMPPTIGNEGRESEPPVLPKRKRKAAPAKSARPAAETLITDEQVLKLIESSEPAVAARDDIVRVTFADGLTLPENNARDHAGAEAEIVREAKNNAANAPRANEKPADIIKSPESKDVAPNKGKIDLPKPEASAAHREASPPARPSTPLPNRQNSERSFNRIDPPPRPISAAVNGIKSPAGSHLSHQPNPPAKNAVSPSHRSGIYNKVFAEQSHSHLQIIRESIGHLYTDPTRQETLRRIKHAAIAVNNLAKRFVFDVVAAYAAAIEEICERVLDGEINMSKKLVNAFTEIPAIFDGMLHGDVDAFVEAKRHQERLQRLADSFNDGEVVQRQTDIKRSTPANFPARGMDATGQKAVAMPAAKTAPLNNRPRPATEVMEYLDDLIAEGKKSSTT